MIPDRAHGMSVLIMFVAALQAVIVATGVLTLVLLGIALLNGQSLGDFYAEVFPRFRGAGRATEIPRLAYVLFAVYVFVASSIGVTLRRRITARRSRR